MVPVECGERFYTFNCKHSVYSLVFSPDNRLFYELQDEEDALSPVKTRFTRYQLIWNKIFIFFKEKEEEPWNIC